MKPKDIFGLAVRLLGLYFLYLALNAVTQMLNSDIFESPDQSGLVSGLVNGLLPVIFDLIVAAWLISGWLIIRMAYPESGKISPQLPAPGKAPQPHPAPPSPQLSEMDLAEKKLASLVEKPGDSAAS